VEGFRIIRTIIPNHIAYLALNALDDCLDGGLAVLIARDVVGRYHASAAQAAPEKRGG
jgi:hypothetical protein